MVDFCKRHGRRPVVAFGAKLRNPKCRNGGLNAQPMIDCETEAHREVGFLFTEPLYLMIART